MPRGFAVYQNEKIDFAELGQLSLFKNVNFASIEGQLQLLPVLMLPAGATLIAPGQPNQVAYLVLSGRLRVFEGDDRDTAVGLIQRGECIGVMSLMDRQPCHVTIVAEQPCRLVALDEERLFALINTSSVVSRNVLFLLMHYLRGKDTGAPERGRLEARLAQNSSVDVVTGLYNQRWLMDILDRQIMRSATDHKPLSLLAIDLDDFSQFNTEFGRNAGDQAMFTIGSLIASVVRPTDLLARGEGDSFVVILPDTNATGADLVAARLQRMIAETEIEIPGECRLPPISASVGVVEMKSFVAGRKLLDDAIAALRKGPETDLPKTAVG